MQETNKQLCNRKTSKRERRKYLQVNKFVKKSRKKKRRKQIKESY